MNPIMSIGTYAALHMPRDDDLSGSDAQRPCDLLNLGDVERLLDESAAAKGRVRFQEQTVVLGPLCIRW